MRYLRNIVYTYLFCPHYKIGGTNNSNCPKCKSTKLNKSEKLFNELLEKEHKNRLIQKAKIDKIMFEIEEKNKKDRDLRNKKEEELRKQTIKNIFEKNKSVIKNKLIENEQSRLEYLLNLNPYDFEKEVAKMFEKNGFETTVTPKTNDGGKDIILKKNGKVYLVECKRYNTENKVGRESLQKFFAAIYEFSAEGGYFITTSDFTTSAYAYPKAINNKIKLINGAKLTNAMEKIYPQNNFLKNYSEVCLVCGELVNFNYPNITKSKCSNNHWVYSTINSIKIELGIK